MPYTLFNGDCNTFSIVFKTITKNGGYVDYTDRELNSDLRYYIIGINKDITFELEFDYIAPGHCYESMPPCQSEALDVEDFITAVTRPIYLLVLLYIQITRSILPYIQ